MFRPGRKPSLYDDWQLSQGAEPHNQLSIIEKKLYYMLCTPIIACYFILAIYVI